MNNFKLRCWHKIEKRFVDLRNIDFETETIGYDSQGEWNRYETEKFENVIFQQFTCLRDKNGADIYEGDIVEFDDSLISERPIVGTAEIIWCNDLTLVDAPQWGLWFVSPKSGFYKSIMGQITIIGNINENPDLLK